MGNSSNSKTQLQKGQGYRILSIRNGSPLQFKTQPFFDFIIDITPQSQLEKSPRQILDKLNPKDSQQKESKSILQLLNKCQNIEVCFKIVSTKHRNVRNVYATPNKTWNGSEDMLGIQLRKQNYDNVFANYYPMKQIANNSPIKKAGVQESQYMIGCLEIKYNSINELIDALYDKFFDKQVLNKNVHFAVYNILKDKIRMVNIQLKRGWGGKGLLGCQFMQGYLHKFPTPLQQYRAKLQQEQKVKSKNKKFFDELKQCSGASKNLDQTLKNNRNKDTNKKHLQNIHALLSLEPPSLPIVKKQSKQQVIRQKKSSNRKQQLHQQVIQRIEVLERKVFHLQNALSSIKDYVYRLQIEEEEQIQERQENLQEKA